MDSYRSWYRLGPKRHDLTLVEGCVVVAMMAVVVSSVYVLRFRRPLPALDLERHQKFWAAQHILDYQYALNVGGPLNQCVVEVTVRGGKRVHLKPLPGNDPINGPSEIELFASDSDTIDKVLAGLTTTLSNPGFNTSVQYNDAVGYPVSVTSYSKAVAADAGWWLHISNFKPLKPVSAK